MFVAIDRVTKFAFSELHERATRRTAADFLHRLIEALPYKIHTVLTDNGTQFTPPGKQRSATAEIRAAIEAAELFRAHAFQLPCPQPAIAHRPNTTNHPHPQ